MAPVEEAFQNPPFIEQDIQSREGEKPVWFRTFSTGAIH